MEGQNKMELSIIIPVYNEEGNVKPLYRQLETVLNRFRNYEIIFVDDGSKDNTYHNITRIKDRRIRIIRLQKNLGLSKALETGFRNARGKVIVTMDGDLQNDTQDIPILLKKLNEGYDVVCGWRYNRKDSLIIKKFPSLIFNILVRMMFNLRIHDCSCTLRAYKRRAVKGLEMFDGAHRYLPLILAKRGMKITEIKVRHHPRVYGESKYKSIKRLFQGLSDLIKIKKSFDE